MQCVKRSYSRARTCSNRAGDRSARISSAIKEIRASQSGGGTGVSSVTFSLDFGKTSVLCPLPSVSRCYVRLTFERRQPRT